MANVGIQHNGGRERGGGKILRGRQRANKLASLEMSQQTQPMQKKVGPKCRSSQRSPAFLSVGIYFLRLSGFSSQLPQSKRLQVFFSFACCAQAMKHYQPAGLFDPLE
jgi:hypothetical protein